MNRTKAVFKNLVWEIGYYLSVILFGFLAPRFIILVYGSEVNGLSSTISQILNIIMLMQAGATTASIFSLYQPIAEKNMEEVSRNISSSEKFFKKISYIFLVLMILIAFVASVYIDTNIKNVHVFMAFIIMGLKSFLDLYFTSKYRVIFTAFQGKYILSIATLIEQIVYYALVFFSIYRKYHFLFIYLWLFIGCITKVLFLVYKYKKTLKKYIPKCKDKTVSNTISGRIYSLANEVSHSIVGSSVTIVMSFLYGFKETSVYSVYALVSNALYLFTSAICSSFGPSFGDLNASGNKESASRIFKIFNFIYIIFNMFIYMCMMLLILPFISLYTSGTSDINYLNTLLAILLSIQAFISALRVPYNTLVSSCGFFKETWKQPVICSVLSIIISVVFGIIDYSLILIGPIVFYLANFAYQHWKLKRLASHLIDNSIFKLLYISLFGFIICINIMIRIVIPEGITAWICYAIICAIGVLIYIFVSVLFFDKSELRLTIKYVKEKLNKHV